MSEDQPIAYVDEEADAVTLDHICRRVCCAEHAGAYAQDQAALRAIFQRRECPSSHGLGEHYLGLLPADEQAVISRDLETCLVCAGELNTLDDFLKNTPTAPWGRLLLTYSSDRRTVSTHLYCNKRGFP